MNQTAADSLSEIEELISNQSYDAESASSNDQERKLSPVNIAPQIPKLQSLKSQRKQIDDEEFEKFIYNKRMERITLQDVETIRDQLKDADGNLTKVIIYTASYMRMLHMRLLER
jgi:hypothetical protein